MWSLLTGTTGLSFWNFFILNSFVTIISTGIWPVSDSLILAALQDKSTYGRVRAWGALTYGLGNMCVGCAIEFMGNFSPMFFLSLVTVFIALFAAYKVLPASASDTNPEDPISLEVVKAILTSSISVKVFFVNSILIGAAMSLVESLLFVAMERTMNGSTPIIAGSSVLISVLFEIPIFQIAPKLISTYGTRRMLIVANMAWMVRAVGYATFDHAWIVLILELFHGVTFGLFYSAAVYICVKQSPKGMESTMQSLLDMTYSGFGVALGTVGGGYLFDYIGTTPTFLLFVALIFASTVLCYLYFEEPRNDAVDSVKDPELYTVSTELETINSEDFVIEKSN